MAATTQFSVTKVSGSFWRVVFDHPPQNLLDGDSVRELEALLASFEASAELKVVVFESAHPEFFFARYDISRSPLPPPGDDGALSSSLGLPVRLAALPVVTIASIRGRTRGGGSELALACDMRFASRERAIFCQPEVPGGFLPGAGGLERLLALAGRARSLEIILSGDDFDAEIAERYGWINRAVPDAELDSFVAQLAHRLARFEKTALVEVKRLVNRTSLPALDDMRESERAALSLAVTPAAAKRIRQARALGARVGTAELERQLGTYMGTLDGETPDL